MASATSLVQLYCRDAHGLEPEGAAYLLANTRWGPVRCPLLAESGHLDGLAAGPVVTSAFDPKRTEGLRGLKENQPLKGTPAAEKQKRIM